jgi:hypothetical protein
VRVSFHTSGRWKNFRTPHFNPLPLFKGRGEQGPLDIGFGFPGLDFGISIFEFRTVRQPPGGGLQNDCLTARRSYADHGQFCSR